MRFAGRISDWNEAKGYGFVVPHDGGDRAFVHIKAFQPGARRPVDGDLISYAISKDGRGRNNAVDIRFAGQRIEAPRPRTAERSRRPLPRIAMALGFFGLLGAGTALSVLPVLVPVAYTLLSLASFLMYVLDKAAAGHGAQRTPESTLHLMDLAGGWPGALIAQQTSRHKTVKTSFQSVFWFTVVANLAAVFWLVHSGTARLLSTAWLGM
ncbi:DUF1294 domain-containing protein [Arenimonas terrae]|uniref:DUF1294 domain-containing protein n=1 Tax=Arenimonas terrae TaxID=2546226 RepID=A0A5C4RNZ3_9GAMM|nr:cold shock and DUF1294 domain-containing protein [Arenimonas terrae]TNJ32976.1 DUF1294 domain-containing protein [Arenimonas terrae]